EAMRVTAQPAPHRFDVLEHSLRAVAGCDRLLARLDALAPYGEELAAHVAEPLGGGARRAAALKLAALLHDVSKPETRQRIAGRRADVVREVFAGWSEQREAETRRALLRGEDVMARFSLEPGPRVGWLLAEAREAQDLGRVRSREEALAYLDSLDPGP